MRIPQGRSIGPFSSSTPRLFSSSSHRIHVVYNERELEPDTRVGNRDVAGVTSSDASLVFSRLMSASPNLKTAELSSSK